MSQELDTIYKDMTYNEIKDEIVRVCALLKSTEDEKKEITKGFSDTMKHFKEKLNYLVDTAEMLQANRTNVNQFAGE